MKTVIFIRHAKSSWKFPELTDFERPLNKRGKRNAPEMALRLKKIGIQPDLIVSSTAVRAKMTATYFAELLNYPIAQIEKVDKIYEAMIKDVFEVIRSLSDDCNIILVFGHNPTFTMIANRFSNTMIANVPTCGMFGVQFKTEKWENFTESQSNFLFFDYPKSIED
ncbi:MAG: histidine phosphatase family protein [Saprospiraceae bacterium]